jgi:hypothetical protein
MKQLLLVIFLGLMYCSKSLAAINFEMRMQEEKINVIFENNSTDKGTKKFKLTIEDPSGGKTVEELTLTDMSRRKTLSLAIGSKVYVENSAKLNTLKGGQIPNKGEPLIIVMLRDKNQSIHLVEEENTSEAIVFENAQKSANKLKLDTDASKSLIVNGNTATVTYKSTSGQLLAEFDCDKKNGNVKNINDVRKKGDNKKGDETTKPDALNKAKSLFGK